MTTERQGDQELEIIKQIAQAFSLNADYLGDESTRTVGVQGDNRTFERIVVLTGDFPGFDVLAEVSTQITNATRANRVVFEIINKKVV